VFKLKAPTSTSINAPNPRASSRDALEKTAPILYSVSEAAAKLCVAPKWLYERTRKNGVPCRRLGKYVRFSDADLAAIVANAFVPSANGSITGNSGIVHGDDRNKTHPQGANDAPSAN
jgi:hypothetical protein